MQTIRRILGSDSAVYNALANRAKRNLRTLRQELRATLREALREEIDPLYQERTERQAAGGERDGVSD